MAAPGKVENAAGGTGALITRKVGPAPVWVWALIGLAVLVLFLTWRRNQGAGAPKDTGPFPDQTPPVIFQSYVRVTPDHTPPAGGRDGPSTVPPTAPPPGGDGPAPTPGPTPNPTPKPPAPSPGSTGSTGQWITVSKYTSSNPPWNSTLSGIASHLLGSEGAWPSIWNDPQNRDLVARRKQPNLIQPGDRIYVHGK